MELLELSWKIKKNKSISILLSAINRNPIIRDRAASEDIYLHLVSLIKLDDKVGKDALIEMFNEGIISVGRIVSVYERSDNKTLRSMIRHQCNNMRSYMSEYRGALELIDKEIW